MSDEDMVVHLRNFADKTPEFEITASNLEKDEIDGKELTPRQILQ